MGVFSKLRNSVEFTRLLLRYVDNSIYDLYVLLNLLKKGWKVKEADENNAILCKEVCLKIRTKKSGDIGHIDEIYERKTYGESFKGVVIDVGASNADSSIFFATNGAEKVIALEPFPESYELGKYNIKINNLDNKVILLPYALTNYEGYVDFIISSGNPNANTVSPSTQVMGLGIKFDQKIKVPTTTLASLIQKYNIDKVYLLKMDCEGCEYAILRDLPAEVLNKIENIILEFHDYPQDLPDILRKAGFNVNYENKPIGILKAYKNYKLA